jgi:RNA polymerase sigma factor (sigma-70 family)
MFGVQEQVNVQSSPTVLMRGAPGSRHERRVVTSSKTGASAGPDRVVMTKLLVAVAEHRDKQAFADLFAHYGPRIKSYLMRQGADAASAEELSQEAMLSVWRKADRFDASKASAGTWIFTVARNLRIDALRKENRPNFDPEDPAFVPDEEVAPDDAVEIGETQKQIRAAIAQLPEEQAEVIRLSFYEDKPHGEIAEELNLPLGTVKSRLRLATRKVRTVLGEVE